MWDLVLRQQNLGNCTRNVTEKSFWFAFLSVTKSGLGQYAQMFISRPKVVILTDEFEGDVGSCVRLEKLIDPCLRSNLYIPGAVVFLRVSVLCG